jgi:hypothetical protein
MKSFHDVLFLDLFFFVASLSESYSILLRRLVTPALKVSTKSLPTALAIFKSIAWMFKRGINFYGNFLNLIETVPFPIPIPLPTPPKPAWTHDKTSMSTPLGNSDSNDLERSTPVSAVVSRPGPARRIISEEEHAPGWRSWLDRENFAFFILGLLVCMPRSRL